MSVVFRQADLPASSPDPFTYMYIQQLFMVESAHKTCEHAQAPAHTST